jgi:hypothetical protein
VSTILANSVSRKAIDESGLSAAIESWRLLSRVASKSGDEFQHRRRRLIYLFVSANLAAGDFSRIKAGLPKVDVHVSFSSHR